MQKDIRKSLIRVVAAPVLVLLVMLILSLTSIRILSNLGISALHSREVETSVRQVLVHFLNMETGLRGYIASHDPVFLEPYWLAKGQIETELSKLDELTALDKHHIEEIKEIRAYLLEWNTYSERVRVLISQSSTFAAPPMEFIQLSGKKLMDKIRESTGAIITLEQNRYLEQSHKVKLSVQWALYSTLGLAIFLALMVASHLRKEILRLAEEFALSLKESQESKAALKVLNENLEETVKQRTADLTSMNEELEAFCYSVSHDLRAPLRGIEGFSDALSEDYAAILPPEAKRYIQFIRQGIQRMGQLIDDLLTLSRLTRAETNIAPLDMGELCKEVEKELETANPNRQVNFVGLEPTVVRGDRALLHAVLTNLLSNAWKFTDRISHARIECGVTEKDGKQTFFVKDNGAGFDMAHSNKLFGAFQRLHSAKEFPGTGVGLATVRRIIKRHGGDVWATGKPGEGATFYFTLGL